MEDEIKEIIQVSNRFLKRKILEINPAEPLELTENKKAYKINYSIKKIKRNNGYYTHIFIQEDHTEIHFDIFERNTARLFPLEIMDILFDYLGSSVAYMVTLGQYANWMSPSHAIMYKTLYPSSRSLKEIYYCEEAPLEEILLIKKTQEKGFYLFMQGYFNELENFLPIQSWDPHEIQKVARFAYQRKKYEIFCQALNLIDVDRSIRIWTVTEKKNMKAKDLPYVTSVLLKMIKEKTDIRISTPGFINSFLLLSSTLQKTWKNLVEENRNLSFFLNEKKFVE